MTVKPNDLATLSRLLDSALELSPAEREPWLASLGEEHAELVPHLSRMLSLGAASAVLSSHLPALDSGNCASDDPVRPGQTVGSYVLRRELGRGGMGSVWLAARADGESNGPVALKLPHGSWVAGLSRRMARERDIGARLQHRHIAKLQDAGLDEQGRPYLVFDYIDGMPIDRWCAQRRLSIRQRVEMVVLLAEALAHAHKHQVIHRDLKPSNVLVTPEGEPCLLDFGIARLLDDPAAAGDLTRTHGRAMTLPYAAPEQILGAEITVATDVYGLGALAYELLTGVRPFRPLRETPAALEEAILRGEAPLASTRTPMAVATELQSGLDQVLHRALHREAGARYASVDEFADELLRWLLGPSLPARFDTARAADSLLPSAPPRRFGPWLIQPSLRQLWRDGEPFRISALVYDLLLVLLERRQRPVEARELFELVTGDRDVESAALHTAWHELQQHFGQDVVAEIPGRGYRFVAPILEGNTQGAADVMGSTASPAGKARINLPAQLPQLLGRDEELASLLELMQRERVVSLVAAGGMGKSLLAQHAARVRGPVHLHGVCWVDLSNVQARDLASAVAGALGIAIGRTDVLPSLVNALKGVDLLLCLDNAEYVADALSQLVQTLVEQTADVCVLVTSQVPLKSHSERVFRLAPLAIPAPEATVSEALQHGAVALFVQRAQAVEHRFVLDTQNLPAVIDICTRLDGMALAIELAAARLPLLGLSRLAEVLDDRLSVLNSGARWAPARQKTLRAALEWSHGLLSEQERAVFRGLSVFAGSFSLDLVQAVLAGPDSHNGLDRWALLDTLGALVDRSLLTTVAGTHPLDSMQRFRLLESLKLLAAEHLAQHPAEEFAVRQHHAQAVTAWFVRVNADRWADRLQVDAGIALLAHDLDNARAALAWQLQHDHAGAVTVAPSLFYALTYDRYEECRRMWLATEAVLDDSMPLRVRTDWTITASRFWCESDPDRALRFSERAVADCRVLGDRQALILALSYRIQGLTFWGMKTDSTQAMRSELNELLSQPLATALSLEVEMYKFYSFCFVAVGLSPEAEICRQRLNALATEAGSRVDRLYCQAARGAMYVILRDWDKAIEQLLQLMTELDKVWDAYVYFGCLENLLSAYVESGKLEAADSISAEAWQFCQRFVGSAETLDALALRAALAQLPAQAAQFLGQADRQYAKVKTRQPVAARMTQRATDMARASLVEEAFRRWHAEGAAMTTKQVDGLLQNCLSLYAAEPATTDPDRKLAHGSHTLRLTH